MSASERKIEDLELQNAATMEVLWHVVDLLGEPVAGSDGLAKECTLPVERQSLQHGSIGFDFNQENGDLTVIGFHPEVTPEDIDETLRVKANRVPDANTVTHDG